ncbi:hypothetical protein [Kitasatospora herbaricolor]|uniref:Uncharacterized protein n=1 Tax=Kitasatospora herbaricolor TaxID=68217 RepID=A0ABZ1WM08_9ACTN|nr:hypothetical protein [Kitasatospora herbaricolor]
MRVLATAPLSEPFMHAMYELAVVALEEAGFAAADVMGVITALESFVLGSALDLVAPPVMVDAVARDAAPPAGRRPGRRPGRPGARRPGLGDRPARHARRLPGDAPPGGPGRRGLSPGPMLTGSAA